ncbi:MAG: cytidylate kinase-like family protein [Chloroflexi bacterium]|nr:cytidylate kinase-like family protein [Chloroflexota bacterium]MDA1004572.1 cytidylate kinase-like family protein [Chloroflexota bacterium]
MSIVTLTGHLGSMGTIAVRVARELDYALADRELMTEAAAALGWSEDEVAAFDERTSGLGSRLTRMLRAFVERAGMTNVDPMMSPGALEAVLGRTYGETAIADMRPDDRQYIETLRSVIGELATRGSVVIVGRGGQSLLADHDNAVHARVVCNQDERIRRVAERDQMSVEDAGTRIRDSDTQREAWHQKYFGIDYRSPYLYHLVVNSGKVSDALAAELIVALARKKSPRPG